MYCPKGKFANETGSASCTKCPAGRYGDRSTETRGQVGSECAGLCAEGHYGDRPGATSRQCAGPCPMGSYSRPGATECKLCPEGRYGDVVGSGVVGFQTMVCSGDCYGAPPGSTCCPKNQQLRPFWVGNCPGEGNASPSPSPSSSLPQQVPTLPSPAASNSSPALVAAAIGITAVALLAAACAYFSFSRQSQEVGSPATTTTAVAAQSTQAAQAVQAVQAVQAGQTEVRQNQDDQNALAMTVPSKTDQHDDKGKPKTPNLFPAQTKAQQIVPASAVQASAAMSLQHGGSWSQQASYQQQQWQQQQQQQQQQQFSQFQGFNAAFAQPNAFAQGMMMKQGQQQQPQFAAGPKKPLQKIGGYLSNLSPGAAAFAPTTFEGSLGDSQLARGMGPSKGGHALHGSQVHAFARQEGRLSATEEDDTLVMFQSCQAKVSLWMQMQVKQDAVVRGASIGRGAYAEVYRGTLFKEITCAIKVYWSTASPSQLQEANREIRITASLDHPCTLRLLGWIRNPLQTITELCFGDLRAFYENKVEVLQYSELEALRLLKVRFCNNCARDNVFGKGT